MSKLKKLILLGVFVALGVFGFAGASWASGINVTAMGNDPYGNYNITATISDSNGSVFYGDSAGYIFRSTASGGFTKIGMNPYGAGPVLMAVNVGNGSILFGTPVGLSLYNSSSGAWTGAWQYSTGRTNYGVVSGASIGNGIVLIGGGTSWDGDLMEWTTSGVFTIRYDITTSNGGYGTSVKVIAPGDGSGIINFSAGFYGGVGYGTDRWTPGGGLVTLPTPISGNIVGVSTPNNPGTFTAVIWYVSYSGSVANLYTWTSAGGFVQIAANVGDYPAYAIGESDGSILFLGGSASNIFRWTSPGGFQNTGITLNYAGSASGIIGMPSVAVGTNNASGTVEEVNLTWTPIFQYNGSQSYWYQQTNFGTASFSGFDFHILVTELDPWGNASSTSYEYDTGTGTTYSTPMQQGKYYQVQFREVSPVSTSWSSPGYVWNAPSMVIWNAGESQITTTAATIKWPRISPNEQMEVWWRLHNNSTWSNSGNLGAGVYSYKITALLPNTQYDVALDPQALPNGGTDWWASQGSFWTDSTPSVSSITIDGGAQGTNLAQATITVNASSTDSPIIAYGLSNNGTSYTWYPYTSGHSNGLIGAYYANPSDAAYGQPLSDSWYINSETDSQVNVGGLPSILSSVDSGNVNWGAVWQGKVWIGQTGTYYFAIPSDDGTSLTINGQVIADDWNVQGVPPAPYTGESGSITFSSVGWYPVLIHYFQGGAGNGIQFLWEPPGASSYSLVPSADLLAIQNGNPNPAGNSVNISTTWGLTGNGSVTVYAEVMTSDGAISPPMSASINLLSGAQNPVLKLTLDNGSSSTTSPTVNYVITATGAGLPTSGQSEYQINGGSWSGYQPFAQTGTVTLPNTPGVYTVNIQVQDGNGLTSQAAAQITLQPAPPPAQNGSSTSGTQGSYDGLTVYFTNAQTVTLAVPNPSKGTPINLQYSFDGISWSSVQPWTTSLSLTLPTGDGLKPVYVQAMDANGVQLAQSSTNFVLDTKTPTITELQTVSGADGTSGSSIAVLLQASEDIAVPLDYSVNGGTPAPIPGNGQISVPITNPTGLNPITITVSDPAGNSTSKILDVLGLAA